MADALKRMYFGQPGNGSANNGTLYTAPAGTGATAIVRTIHVSNTTASTATVSLGINGTPNTAANAFYSSFSIPANGIHVWNGNIVLEGGDTLQGFQGTGSALTVVISGVTL